jgi:hypothetical protein
MPSRSFVGGPEGPATETPGDIPTHWRRERCWSLPCDRAPAERVDSLSRGARA